MESQGFPEDLRISLKDSCVHLNEHQQHTAESILANFVQHLTISTKLTNVDIKLFAMAIHIEFINYYFTYFMGIIFKRDSAVER